MSTLIKKSENKFFPGFFTDLFDPEFFSIGSLWDKSITKMTPSVNIKESAEQYTLEMAAPGMKKEDFKIEIRNGVLTISASKKEEKTESDEKYNRREFYYSSFSRSFTLPENVNEQKIKASYNNGLLILDIPKTQKSETGKTIQVQ